MNRQEKNAVICKLSEVLLLALSEDGIKDSNDLRAAIDIIKQVDGKFTRFTLGDRLSKIAPQYLRLAENAALKVD